MGRLRRWGLLLAILVLLSGCVTRPNDLSATAPPSDGVLKSGRYSTQQGVMRFQREFVLHADGRVSEIQTVEGTYKFADFWRERFNSIDTARSDYSFTKDDTGTKLVLKAKKTYTSVESFNENANAEVALLDGPLFRSVSFRAETGAFDPDSMVRVYGVHEQATAEDWVEYLRSAIAIGYVVTDESTGRTYRWDRTAGQIGDGLAVVIQAKQWHALAYWGGGAISLFLLFVIYMGIFGRRHWDNREQE